MEANAIAQERILFPCLESTKEARAGRETVPPNAEVAAVI
jgi:hypothetical protein